MKLAFIGKTKATITAIDVQSKKEGQTDLRPAVCVHFQVRLPNSSLAMLDKRLQNMLFEKGVNRQLDGVDQVSELNSLTNIAENIGHFTWADEQTGCRLNVYQGIGEAEHLKLMDGTVRKTKVTPQDGGTVQYDCQFYTATDIDAEMIGALGVLKNQDRDIELLIPEALSTKQKKIEDGMTPEEALAASTETMGGVPVKREPKPKPGKLVLA